MLNEDKLNVCMLFIYSYMPKLEYWRWRKVYTCGVFSHYLRYLLPLLSNVTFATDLLFLLQKSSLFLYRISFHFHVHTSALSSFAPNPPPTSYNRPQRHETVIFTAKLYTDTFPPNARASEGYAENVSADGAWFKNKPQINWYHWIRATFQSQKKN